MKLSYSGNYHSFNKLIKQLDNRVSVGDLSAPVETMIDGKNPAVELSNVYHALQHFEDEIPSSFVGLHDLNMIISNLKEYLDEYHKSPYQD